MSPRVGIVVVSHSAALAHAAVALATEMVAEDPPTMVVAAGTPDGGTGTDASAVAAAIEEADAGAGVVALLDLGSAIMSAELALEFVTGEVDVRLVPAPFVEGLVAAAVRAAAGAGIDEVSREAAGALGPKIAQLGDPGEQDASIRGAVHADDPTRGAPPSDVSARAMATMVNVAGLHARPAAAIAAAVGRLDARVWVGAGGEWADASSPTSLAVLTAGPGQAVDIVAEGPAARASVEAVAALVKSGFGEEIVSGASGESLARDGEASEPDDRGDGQPREAIGASPGRVVGPAWQAGPPRQPPTARRVPEPERASEGELIRPACAEVSRRLREIASRSTGQGAAIMEATAAIATDPALLDRATALCGEGRDAESAVWEAAGALAASLQKAGGVIAERATDVLDVRDRVIALLAGSEPPVVRPPDGHVLIAHDVAAADAVELDPAWCLAIVTEGGAATSHTAIIARELAIPAVVGASGATSIAPGTTVLVDGDTGQVVVDPDRE